MTGEVIRASKTTAVRYERDRPGELVHLDVKKIGRLPDGGGWRAHGRAMGSTGAKKRARIGYDYIHSMVDDHTRLAYSEIHSDERGDTAAGFIERATSFFARARHQPDRADHDRQPLELHQKPDRRCSPCRSRGRTQGHQTSHCPWQNGKVELFNRTLQTEWAYRQVFTSNNERCAALPNFIHNYNGHRRHHALGGHPPTS